MDTHQRRAAAATSRAAVGGVLALGLILASAAGSASRDALAGEIARWTAYLNEERATDEMFTQVKAASGPALSRADEALRAGHRLLALQRLMMARINVAAAAYMLQKPATERVDTASFEAEWSKTGSLLRDDLRPPRSILDGVRPLAVRALGELAVPQVRAYYEASLEYGRNTMAQAGFFYIGAALAQRDFAALCRSLSEGNSPPPPAMRPLEAELDELEAGLLKAYRPPASIDRHSEFIVASSAVHDARELDAAGLRAGALLRYLQAAARVAPLRSATESMDAAALTGRLHDFEARLSVRGVDHSIGRLLLEDARSQMAASPTGAMPAGAVTIATEVLPRYFAALQPEPGGRAAARPRLDSPAVRPVTVTLVRWPYT
jgi:hypothetical protein